MAQLLKLCCLAVLAFICVILISSTPVLSHYTSPSAADLTIPIVSSTSRTVTLSDRKTKSPIAECTFRYVTTELGLSEKKVAAVAPPVDGTAKVDISEVTNMYDGQCIQSTADYWSYELCFGRSVKQFHGGDTYTLAKVSSTDPVRVNSDKKTLTMGGGDLCTAANPQAARRVVVTFACRTSATTPQLVSIHETSTCVYEVQVASQLLCRDPSYPVTEFTPSAPSAWDDGSEDWFMELTEIENAEEGGEPILMCQAYSLEYRASSVKGLKFVEYELKINRKQGSTRSSSDDLPAPYRTPTVRKPNRVNVPVEDLAVEYGAVVLAPQSDSTYDGTISLVKVYA